MARVAAFIMSFVVAACATTPERFEGFQTHSFHDLQEYILNHQADVGLFEKEGPFSYSVQRDFKIRVSLTEIVNTDAFLSRLQGKAPLIIIQHGNHAEKAFHEEQARHLASWGMHVLVVSQPNENRWIKNGKTLSELVTLLHTWPNLLDGEFDRDKIILVGHSFGGSAIAIAAGLNAPVKGLIFLDPALVSRQVKKHLAAVKIPAIILGADLDIFISKHRSAFYASLSQDVMEVSIKDATHNDAQFPDQFDWGKLVGLNWTSEARQRRFAAAIVASAFSLTSADRGDFIWQAIQPELRRGAMIHAKRKRPDKAQGAVSRPHNLDITD